MPSPDITPYSDLTPYDLQPDEVYDKSIEYARNALPEWYPVAGTIEDAMLQSAATVTGELLAALNRVPASVLEALLKLFGIERSSGTRPTGTVSIDFIDDVGHVVPSGTRFGWLDRQDFDSTLYVLETTETVTARQGDTSITVGVRGISLEQYPDIEAGTRLRMLSSVSFINQVTLLQDLDIGSGTETDEEYFARAIAQLGSYTEALVLPKQFERYLLSEYSDIYRAKAYNRLHPDDTIIGEALGVDGRLTIYACGLNGASLSATAASAVVEDLVDRSVAGLAISIQPPRLVDINVRVAIQIKPTYEVNVVMSAVKTRLDRYLHPNYWSWGDTIFYNEVVSAVDAVEGVARVDELVLEYPPKEGVQLEATVPVNTFDLAFTYYGSLPNASIYVTGRPYVLVDPLNPI